MRLGIFSDLHLEFGGIRLEKGEAQVIILAGDIQVGVGGMEWARRNFPHLPVIYVAGNHEFYHRNYRKLLAQLRREAEKRNIFFLENEAVTLGEITFLGCTLWTDFELFGDARRAGLYCSTTVNDFRLIRLEPDYHRLRTTDARNFHFDSRNWLRKELAERRGQKCVVVTHHAPSAESLPREFREDPAGAAYASHLEELVAAAPPALWIHGHIHSSVDYHLGSCRVLSNPRGYVGEENQAFRPDLLVEV
jgi:predicted phosphodiesterase